MDSLGIRPQSQVVIVCGWLLWAQYAAMCAYADAVVVSDPLLNDFTSIISTGSRSSRAHS